MYKAYAPINIWGNPKIGSGTTIGAFSEIGDGVVIGEKCKIQAFAYICPGVEIGNNVFIGPRVTFTNDKYPPSDGKHWKKTIVEDNVSIGGGTVICPGVIIKEGSMIGAGSVVTRDVEAGDLVYGNPARKHGSRKKETND